MLQQVVHKFNNCPTRCDCIYSISVGSSICLGCWHPSSGAHTTVITASGTGQPGLLPSTLIVDLELNTVTSCWTIIKFDTRCKDPWIQKCGTQLTADLRWLTAWLRPNFLSARRKVGVWNCAMWCDCSLLPCVSSLLSGLTFNSWMKNVVCTLHHSKQLWNFLQPVTETWQTQKLMRR